MKIVFSDQSVKKWDYSFEKGVLEKLGDADFEALPWHPGEENREFMESLKDADGLLTAYIPVDGELLAHAPRLKCISLLSTGFNTIDLEACKKHGVRVCNVKEYCTGEVASHTMALLLALTRLLKKYDKNADREIWSYRCLEAPARLSSLTLCVFGYGKIGREVARLAKSFGMRVGVVSGHLSQEQAALSQVVKMTREQAMEEGDVISNHMALSKATENYFDEDFFHGLKKTPVFINVGRGGSVDEEALIKALDEGWIRGAGLDVLHRENPDLTGHPLLHRDNVILTPHAAFYSEESMKDLRRIACENMMYALTGRDSQVKGFVV